MLERIDHGDDSIHLFKDDRGQHFVGVTSAIKYLQIFLKDKPDYYGPLAQLHQIEGTWCHATCLDWMAHKMGWLETYEPPQWNKDLHPDERRMRHVLHDAQRGFEEFCDQYEVEALAVEAEGKSVPFGLVGHVDLPCRLTYKKRRIKVVCDLKFVDTIQPGHELQVRCYHTLAEQRDAQMGLLWHHNRNTGTWKPHFVDLNKRREDVKAVSDAANVFIWNYLRNP